MAGGVFIDVGELACREFAFDASFTDAALAVPQDWTVSEPLHATGKAELLDPRGARTIRVWGRLDGRLANICARCLEPIEEKLEGEFDLYFYPMSLIARSEERAITRDETEAGFYEQPGIPLVDVVREQVLLWLPMKALCSDECKGCCPQCGVNRNRTACNCHEEKTDSRWQALRDFKLN